MQEERQRVARARRPGCGRVHDAMGRRGQHVVGEALQHVAHVDHDLTRAWRSAASLPSRRKISSPGSPEPISSVIRLMSSCAAERTPARHRCAQRRIVQRAQDAVAVIDAGRRTSARGSSRCSATAPSSALPERIERAPQRQHAVAKSGTSLRPQVRRQSRCGAARAGSSRPTCQNSFRSGIGLILRGLDAERRVAALAAAAG